MIGIISDTHDRLDAIDEAVRIFNSKGVSAVIHAGDFVAPFTAPRFAALKAPMWGVFGNNDGERAGLAKKFAEIGVELRDFLELEHDGIRICAYHGTIEGILASLARSGKYDLVVTGHNHKVEIAKEGRTTVVNPGEACGYLTGKRTLCLWEDGEAEVVEF